MTEKLQLKYHPLRKPFVARAANGHLLRVDSYARVYLRMANACMLIHFRIVAMVPQLILENPFLKKYNPRIDWKNQVMEFDYKSHRVVVDTMEPPPFSAYSEESDLPLLNDRFR